MSPNKLVQPRTLAILNAAETLYVNALDAG